ncbi:MAG TPA: nicotinate-nucleotide adenylyltransferase [Acetobacteraceae bacterium]|nr:nicotinate-nucleotide adenylyltransferase [Acetobacteraceae bacterium]
MTRPSSPNALPNWGDRRAVRVGLLGGSFNPGHAGHLHIARLALRRLRLDQVWLLVSPGNPLKAPVGMAPLADRLRSAQAIADGRRIVATDIEQALGTRFTLDTLRMLRRRFPRVRFVWLMGADNLAQLPRWRRFRAMVGETQIAVLPRPTYTLPALSGRAARLMRRARVPDARAPALALLPVPHWVVLHGRENALSATLLRHAEILPPGELP